MNAAQEHTLPLHRPAPFAAGLAGDSDRTLSAQAALSALADGELPPEEELARCFQEEEGERGLGWSERWEHYQLIGEVLRGTPDVLAATPPNVFLAGLRARLASEAVTEQVAIPAVAPPMARADVSAAAHVRGQAANDPVFRWKVVAAAASLAAVMAVSWTLLGTAPGAPSAAPAGGQLALLGGSQPAPAAPVAIASSAPALGQAVAVNTPQGVVIRDAQLEERLAEHRRYGGMSALQMPAGFLRNATYDAPSR